MTSKRVSFVDFSKSSMFSMSKGSELWSDHVLEEFDLERLRAADQWIRDMIAKAGGGGVAAPVVKVTEEQAVGRPSKTVSALSNPLESAAARRVAQLAARSLAGVSFEQDHGSVTGEFKCPPFVQVDGKRASIPATFSVNSELIREELIRMIGGVPEKTFIKFTYDFKRDAARKLLDVEGDVTVILKW
jgi:hypothetical protein